MKVQGFVTRKREGDSAEGRHWQMLDVEGLGLFLPDGIEAPEVGAMVEAHVAVSFQRGKDGQGGRTQFNLLGLRTIDNPD